MREYKRKNPLMVIFRIVLWIFALFGVFTFLFFFIVIKVAVNYSDEKKVVPEKAVLTMNFQNEVLEYTPETPFVDELLGKKRVTVFNIIDALEKASTDVRIKGVVAKIGSGKMSFAQIQEIREAVINFRKSGKKAVAYAETFGEIVGGNKSYYLATAFDEIYLQPAGSLGLTGLAFESMFLKGALKKLGIKPEGGHRKEYKSYWNMYTEDKYTEPHRESMQKIMDSIFSVMVKDIAEARGMEEAKVRDLIDKAPFTSDEAHELGFINGVKYRDEVYALVEKKEGDPSYVGLKSYLLSQINDPFDESPAVALIYADGAIYRGKSDYDPFSGKSTIGSDTAARAIRDAVKDPEIKAIILRVNSPGGSVIASETIWREVVRAKASGKPVIITMSSLAASGGYYISMAADKIIARPSTITGSIGVVVGKMYTEKLWEKLGITFDSVATSKNARIFSSTKALDEEQKLYLEKFLDRTYSTFTARVAEGRKLTPEKAEAAAKGRAWTGLDAKELGLVDELGGFPLAIKSAKEMMKLKPEDKIRFKRYPEEMPFFQQLLESDEEAGIEMKIDTLSKIFTMISRVTEMGEKLGLTQDSDTIIMHDMP